MTWLYNKNKDWVHFLSRPFTLFGASLWAEWYKAPAFKEIFEFEFWDMLFVEEPRGIVRNYRIKEQLQVMEHKAMILVQDKQEYCQMLLERGIALNKEAEKILKNHKDKNIRNLKEAVEFLCTVAVFATIVPFLAYEKMIELNIKNKKLRILGEKLRAESYYPRLTRELVIPLAKEHLKNHGIENVEQAVELLTINDILANKTKHLEASIKARAEGKQFIYQKINNKETVQWTNNAADIVMRLEHIQKEETQQLKGQIACRGKVSGIARIILTMSKDVQFDDGDILITICSNPEFMPLITKSAAIVTDEGGLTCHAAIISRELNKPCIIGTKYATTVIKDGDLVEVDAEKGIIRKIQ